MTDDLTSPETLDDFVNHLRLERTSMPKRLRAIADAMIARPDDLALLSITEMAQSLDASPSALVRFAKSIGFDGFAPMQKTLRRVILDDRDTYRDRARKMGATLRGKEGDISHVLDAFALANISAIEGLTSSLDLGAVADAVAAMRKARLIGVVGQRRSFPLASYLYYGLLRLDEAAILLDGVGGMLDRAAPLGPKDVLVVIAFAPYAEQSVAAAREAVRRGSQVIALTDEKDSPLCGLADVAILVQESNLNNIRSIAATATVIQTIFVALGMNSNTSSNAGKTDDR
ncbi:MurR/RpiR family transcriptional regulator [Oceaniglobus trochenteri]|uniref:MurR/RpiR family transcriptional regulator n=1 Tax=Oceaniglobus trochenteri TaxID=2763260 RepID=UPI001CFFE89C|nr:MurR/RpiR family transcriptional regulator [Oceaniglobus trochenteri]